MATFIALFVIICFLGGLIIGRQSARKKINALEHDNQELYQEYMKLVKDVFGDIRRG